MLAEPVVPEIRSVHIRKEISIDAAIEIAFRAVLEELGPGGQMPDGSAFPMKLEAWPGGRWYRDLGNNAGHLWGHVQVIKPPALIELCGPMFMSYAATSHVQYRLKAESGGTHLTLTHRAMGQIPDDHMSGMSEGWAYSLQRVQEIAAAMTQKGR